MPSPNTRFHLARTLGAVLTSAALLAACGGKSEADLLASGQKLMAEKDLSGAIIQFKSALQKQPESKDGRLLLGRALLDSGDPTAALVELQKAQELQASDNEVLPAIARAMLLLGDEAKLIAQHGQVRLTEPQAAADLLTTLATAHTVRGDLEKARALINQALQTVPGYQPAVVLEARLKAADNDFDGALALLEQTLAKGDADGRAGMLKGDILWQGKKDPEGALSAYKAVLAAHPKAVGAYTASITIYNIQNKVAEAKAQLEALKKALPHHPETLFFSAQMAFADKEYKASREITDRLLKAMPENPRVLELAGAAEYRLGQYPQAEAFLAKALKSVPGMTLSRQLLAQTYLRTNQPSKVIELLTPVLEGKGADGVTLALAAEAWGQMGDTQKADAAFAAATKAAPGDNRVRTSAAMAQLARGNAGAAIGQLESIAAEDKGTRADIALISARLRQNDLAGAIKAIDGLEAKTPDRPIAANLRGRVLLIKKDFAGATKAFEAALAKDPHYFPAVASLAALEVSNGKNDAAKKRFEDLAKAKPKSHEPWLALAELASRGGEPVEQVQLMLRSAVKANTGDPVPHLALLNHLLSLSDGKAALTAAREAAAALPQNLDVQEVLGRAQVMADNAEQAVATFKQLVSARPTNPVLQLRLAEALLANKDNDGARRAVKRALEISPEMVAAKRALVSLALVEKKPDEGLALVREMQRKDPKDATNFGLEGDLEVTRKNWEAAAAAYRKSLLLTRSTEGAVRLHATLNMAGKTADAERVAADWLKDHPKDVAFRFHLGDTALNSNPQLAESHYRSVLEIQPRNALAMNNIAWLLVQQGKAAGAVKMATAANEILPGRPQLMDTLATALAADGKLDKAIELQKSALSRTPSDPSLKLNLAKLLIKSGDKAYARAELEDIAKLGDRFKGQAEVAALLKTL
jgi:cellulose synthase operon protein C